MNSEQLWLTFWETGAPEIYVLYNQAKNMEAINVSDDQRSCITHNTIQ